MYVDMNTTEVSRASKDLGYRVQSLFVIPKKSIMRRNYRSCKIKKTLNFIRLSASLCMYTHHFSDYRKEDLQKIVSL